MLLLEDERSKAISSLKKKKMENLLQYGYEPVVLILIEYLDLDDIANLYFTNRSSYRMLDGLLNIEELRLKYNLPILLHNNFSELLRAHNEIKIMNKCFNDHNISLECCFLLFVDRKYYYATSTAINLYHKVSYLLDIKKLLCGAVENENYNIVKCLLSHLVDRCKGNRRAKRKQLDPAVCLARRMGNPEIIKLLMEHY